jgi:hypothetical protein
MKSPFKTLLETVLIISLILSGVLLLQYFFKSRQLRTAARSLQVETRKNQQLQVHANLLAQEAWAFRQKDQSIDPVLKVFGIVPQAPQTNQPAN